MDARDTADNPPPTPPGVVTRDQRSQRVLTGVTLIVLGMIFLVDRMGWQWGWHLSFGRLWPVLLIVAGLGTAFTDRDVEVITTHDAEGRPQTSMRPAGRRRYGDGLFLVLVGVLMLLHVNHWMRLTDSWPLFVVAAGVSVMFGRGRGRGRGRRYRRWEGR